MRSWPVIAPACRASDPRRYVDVCAQRSTGGSPKGHLQGIQLQHQPVDELIPNGICWSETMAIACGKCQSAVMDDLPEGVERVQPWDDPRVGRHPDPGRFGSPYTFEGQLARSNNILNSLTSRDPVFRRKARRRFLSVYLFLWVAPVVLTVIAVLR
jgi:hypothetical protein